MEQKVPKAISDLVSKLPELAKAQELVDAGVFPTVTLINRLRNSGKGPKFLRVSDRSVRYPKDEIQNFLIEKWNTKP